MTSRGLCTVCSALRLPCTTRNVCSMAGVALCTPGVALTRGVEFSAHGADAISSSCCERRAHYCWVGWRFTCSAKLAVLRWCSGYSYRWAGLMLHPHQLPSGGSCAAQLVKDACTGQHSVPPTATTGTLPWHMHGVLRHIHCYSSRMYRQWHDFESKTGDNTPQLSLAIWHEGHSRWSQHGSAMHANMPTRSQQRQLAADEPQKQIMLTRQ